ncbi:DNA-binding NarL/FixJ family response regulator [Oxalobacteraceae bacterium GrIS 2.11]
MENTPTKILIVDDNESIRGLLGVLFRHERYEVVGELSSGDNLITTVKRLQPDIVCLDQEMPGKDGLTLLKELKEIDPKAAVLMITGTKDPEFQLQAVSAGVAGFLRKPFSQIQVLKEIKQVDHARRLLLNQPTTPPAETTANSINMVIADDSSIMRDLLSMIMKSMGINIVGEAMDGQEAVTMADQHKPQAMCLDLDMPNLAGMEALEKIKSDHPDIKIIIISGHADREKVKRAIELGACGFIIKPFEAQQVVQTVRKLLL